jgi:ribosome-associated protein
MTGIQDIEFVLRGEHIALDALMKASGLAESGGRAKVLIGEGGVRVDGQPEARRACKIRAGQVVEWGGARVRVLPAPVAP